MMIRDLIHMAPDARKLALIPDLTGEELAGWHMGRALARREPVPGENAALAARERELRAGEKRGRR